MDFVVFATVFGVLSTILWRLSAIWRYYAKYLIYGVMNTILFTILMPLMLIKPRDPRNGILPSKGIVWSSCLVGLKITIEGEENFVRDTGSIILINHQSMLDLFVLAKIWISLDNCTIVGKRTLLWFQPFALGAWLCGNIFINRDNKDTAKKEINSLGELIQKRKAHVMMFPEGTRNFTDKVLLPLKKGAFHLALSSKCPIQPVAVCKYTFLGHHRFESGHIRIKVLPAISVEGYSNKNFNELIEKSSKVLSENIELMTREI